MPEEDQAMAKDNMYKIFGTDQVCGSGDILTDRHTDILSQYFSTTTVSNVNIKTCSCHSHLRLTHQTYLTTNDLCCNAIINISKPLLHNSLHTFHFQCCSYLPDFTVFCANLWCNYKKMQW